MQRGKSAEREDPLRFGHFVAKRKELSQSWLWTPEAMRVEIFEAYQGAGGCAALAVPCITSASGSSHCPGTGLIVPSSVLCQLVAFICSAANPDSNSITKLAAKYGVRGEVCAVIDLTPYG
jgi:hypothetical protein